MIEQNQASSNPALVHELLKRHMEGGSKPKVKIKVKMELPKHAPAKHPTGPGRLAANQWQGQ